MKRTPLCRGITPRIIEESLFSPTLAKNEQNFFWLAGIGTPHAPSYLFARHSFPCNGLWWRVYLDVEVSLRRLLKSSMIFCDQCLSTCGLHAAKLLLHAIMVMRGSDELQREAKLDVFSLTSLPIHLLFQIISSFL